MGSTNWAGIVYISGADKFAHNGFRHAQSLVFFV